MSKLTLSVDDRVIASAKRYARLNGVSVSGMVESFLSSVAEPVGPRPDTPVLRSLRGSLKTGSVESYRRHLQSKYR